MRGIAPLRSIGWLLLLTGVAGAKPQAIEVGPGNTSDLPGGREADGIIGDFVLRNDRIEAVISGNQHERKANMVIFWDKPAPGCLYDLTLRGENNDQLTYFGPAHQRGPLSQVHILKNGDDGEAIVRAYASAASNDGLHKTHDYILRAGWRHLTVLTTYRNESDKPITVKPAPNWIGLVDGVPHNGISTALCQDSNDKVGYAHGPAHWEGADNAAGEHELSPGETKQYAVAIAVGRGSADAYGVIAGLAGSRHRLSGQVNDSNGTPVSTAEIRIPVGDKHLILWTDDKGRYDLSMPEPSYEAVISDMGRADHPATLVAGDPQLFEVDIASAIHLKVTSESGEPLPCKVQFIGIDGTKTPHLGPVIRAHGCENQYHSENGDFTQPLPPGKYRIVVTRGIEFDHAVQTVDLPAHQIITVNATLRRIVDTTGWVSTDFHNHTTVSGDNYCGTDDRIINLAAEHIEFAPATEHNRIYDWQPHVDKLGLSHHVRTCTGIELTGPGAHLNAFPLKDFRYRQDNGAPKWDPDPRINAIALRRFEGDRENRWVHLNHPDVPRFFNDRDNDKQADGGFTHLESFVDAGEFWWSTILSGSPNRDDGRHDRVFGWLQLLNQGRRVWNIAVSDAHKVTQGGVGGWRTYVPSATDEPAKIDIAETLNHARNGHSFVTNGPFMVVTTDDGKGPGDTIRSNGTVMLNVRVQCNTWTAIDRVAVLIDGRVDPNNDFRKAKYPDLFRDGVVQFERELHVRLQRDAHLIVAATGEHSTLVVGYGQSRERDWNPVAYHNPIFVDTDGDGFTPSGDTLGHPFLIHGLPTDD